MTATEAIKDAIAIIENTPLKKHSEYKNKLMEWIRDTDTTDEAVAYVYGDQLIEELKKLLETINE